MFDGRYFAATLAHAAAWRDLASTCADGTVAACVELGVQLRDRPPSLVLGAKLAFDAACELGDDAACATAAELKQRLRLASAGDLDDDGDGLAGCDDPDCWSRCTPTCLPGAICDDALPHCGDGACGAREDYALCPTDCVAP